MSGNIKERIQKIFSKFIINKNELEAVFQGKSILKTISIDSLTMVNMVVELEKEFGIRFDAETLDKTFENIGTLKKNIADSVQIKI